MILPYSCGKYYRIVFYCIACFILLSGYVNAQTPVFIETFGNTSGVCDQGTLANGFVGISGGTWTVTTIGINDSAANEWYISAAEPGIAFGNCSAPGCWSISSYTDRTLHIGNVPNSPNAALCPSGDCGAVYDPGIAGVNAVLTNKRVESPAFAMQAGFVYQMLFNYVEVGDDPGTSDNMSVEFFDGTTWVPPIANPTRSTVNCGVGSYGWEKYTITLPVSPTNINAKIGFNWTNNNDTGSFFSVAIDSIFIFQLPPPVAIISVSDTDLCVNDCIDFFADSVGPVASYNWTFVGGTPPVSSQRNPTTICYSTPGTYQAKIVITTASGTDSDSLTIVVNPCAAPIADFTVSDSVFCERSCITFTDLSTSGPTGWSWLFPGGIPSSSSSPSPPPICYATPGFYDVTLIAYNQFGADTLTRTAYLDVDTCPLPIADFNSVPTQFCPQHCVSFTDNSQFGPILDFQWSFPGGTPSTSTLPAPAVCYDQEGQYDVELIVTNQYGSDTIYKYSVVTANFVNGAYASPDTEMFFGSSYQMNSGGGASYLWSPYQGLDSITIPNPVATPLVTTTYTVAISDSAGCTAYRQVNVVILHNNDLFLPNSFSPNGDGANDEFRIRGNNLYGARLTVFDRWGEKVFESTDPSFGWNGTYKGKDLPPAVFTWVATVNYNNKESVTQSGTVTLVR